MHGRVEEMLERFELKSLRRRAPHELSGGEKQRVALAGVMAMRPHYLILDEPTSLLDYPGRMRLFETIANLRRAKTEAGESLAVLLITQFAEETLFAGRLLVLHRGALVMDGPLKELLQRSEELTQIGLQSPIEFRAHRGLLETNIPVSIEDVMLSPVL
jgi:energy-coupling factor transport system ATP-binding protein